MTALQRHLRVLDAFDAFRPFLTLSELAAASGMPHSTVHRIVGELTREGLLDRMPDRTYRLGVRMWEYASRAPGAVGLREVARPWMSAAHARIRQHTQLGVRAGTDVLFIERMSTRDAVVNATLIGGRIPLHASSGGIVLLAAEPEERAEALIAELASRGMRAFTPHTIASPDDLRRALRRARADGVAVLPGHIHVESKGIAVPVASPDGTVYASLGAVVSTGSSELPVIETLRVAAAGIARGLAEAYGPGGAGDGAGAHSPAGVSDRSWAYIASLDGRLPPAPPGAP